jgi:general secretion pathway protein F
LREGKTLSAALEQVPDAFPPLIRATVRASERTGGLAEALVRYIVYETQIDSVRKKLISATIYPITLMMAGLLVLVFLLGYVVPRFSQVYADMGGSLPWLTRILLEWGQLIDRHGMVVLAAAVVSAVFAWRWLRSPASRRQLAAWLWRVPAIGTYVHTHQLARFYRTLGMLLRGGVAVAHALRMVDGLLSPGMQSRLHGAQTMIHDGRSISEAMETHGLVTPVALRMLRVGERSGRMGEMMEKIAEFHDEETARRLDWFAKLFEPLLMAVIGIVIGVIVLLMYLPIFEIAGNIQ